MGWAAIGGVLAGIGAPVGAALAVWGASSHLWGDDYFLAGFSLACLLTTVGVYVLVAEFIGEIGPLKLRLPRTRYEREAERETPLQRARAHVDAARARQEAEVNRLRAREQDARQRQREDAAIWINGRREEGNAMLTGWPSMRNVPMRCADAVRWEQATYDGLAEHARTHRAHFRDENGLGAEWGRQRRGPQEYEDAQRAMLRRRLHRLAEIAERLQP
jgi:hypothetical protein